MGKNKQKSINREILFKKKGGSLEEDLPFSMEALFTLRLQVQNLGPVL
jgi:hypothetical protein